MRPCSQRLERLARCAKACQRPAHEACLWTTELLAAVDYLPPKDLKSKESPTSILIPDARTPQASRPGSRGHLRRRSHPARKVSQSLHPPCHPPFDTATLQARSWQHRFVGASTCILNSSLRTILLPLSCPSRFALHVANALAARTTGSLPAWKESVLLPRHNL